MSAGTSRLRHSSWSTAPDEEAATGWQSAGWSIRTSIVVTAGDVTYAIAPVTLPVRIEDDGGAGKIGQNSYIGITTIQASWDRDSGTVSGLVDVTISSELMNTAAKPLFAILVQDLDVPVR